MLDRGPYDSAMFWLAFATAAAVIGLATQLAITPNAEDSLTCTTVNSALATRRSGVS